MQTGGNSGTPMWSRRAALATGVTGVATALGPGPLARRSSGGDDPRRNFDGYLLGVAAASDGLLDAFAHPATGLVPDRIDVSEGRYRESDRTSPANVGLQLLATVGAMELGVLSPTAAETRVDRVLATLAAADTWHGLFRRWYDVADGSVHESPSATVVSTIDNAWLSAGLVVAAQAFDGLSARAHSLVAGQNYGALYTGEVDNAFEGTGTTPGFLHASYDPDEGRVGTFGVCNSETRLAYYVAIGKGDVPIGSWWRLYRTFPPTDGFAWTNQRPAGQWQTYETPDGPIDTFEGYYTAFGDRFVPSWGGSAFEALMPALVVDEAGLGTENFAVNDRRCAEFQVRYARRRGYDAWGFSPAATPDGGYDVFGVGRLGISGYERDDVVTPHATFLALEYLGETTVASNFQQFEQWDARGEFGLYDSIEHGTGRVTRSYLVLDQAMSIAAIANRLAGGRLREYFHADPIADAAETLLATEQFSIAGA